MKVFVSKVNQTFIVFTVTCLKDSVSLETLSLYEQWTFICRKASYLHTHFVCSHFVF